HVADGCCDGARLPPVRRRRRVAAPAAGSDVLRLPGAAFRPAFGGAHRAQPRLRVHCGRSGLGGRAAGAPGRPARARAPDGRGPPRDPGGYDARRRGHPRPARPTVVVPGSRRPALSLVDHLSALLEKRTSRRSLLIRTAVAGSALAVAPLRFLIRPETA